MNPTPHFRPTLGSLARLDSFGEEGIVDTLGVSLNVPLEALEEVPDASRCLARHVLEEHVVLVGHEGEEGSLPARLTRCLRNVALGLNADPGGVRRDAEGSENGVLLHGDDDATEPGPTAVDPASECAAVDWDADAPEALFDPEERQPVTEFLCDYMSKERRCRERATHEGRRNGGHLAFTNAITADSLILHTRDDQTTQTASFVGQLGTLLEARSGGLPLGNEGLEERVWDLDAIERQVQLRNRASSTRRLPRGRRLLRGTTRVDRRDVAFLGWQLPLQGVERFGLLLELQLELRRVYPLGLGDEEPLLQKSEFLGGGTIGLHQARMAPLSLLE